MSIDKYEIQNAINIFKLMIKGYENKGGGYSQIQALKYAIKQLPKHESNEKQSIGCCPHCLQPIYDEMS